MTTEVSRIYEGSELDLFARAIHWKGYLRSRILPHLHGSVLEVGAGNGSNTQSLLSHATRVKRWTCLEPDPRLAAEIRGRSLALPASPVEVRVGTTASLGADEVFDCALYIDVLEHIEDDRGEVERVLTRLAPGGRLVVLVPAHQFLFSPFDASVGHFRRYDRRSLKHAVPGTLPMLELRYLDSVGLLASLANRLLMKQSMPTLGQIHFWDSVLVRSSRLLDPVSGFLVGKSLLGVWQK